MKLMRIEFCPKNMLIDDGSGDINHDYFYPKPKGSKWTDIEGILLLEGIYRHGVAGVEAWSSIAQENVPGRSFGEVRLKLSELLQTRDLQKYEGVKFESEEQIRLEAEKNRALLKEKYSVKA
jgi:hypothetical protein